MTSHRERQAARPLVREDPSAPFWAEGVIMDPGGD